MESLETQSISINSDARHVHNNFFASRKLCCNKDELNNVREIVLSEVLSALARTRVSFDKQQQIAERIVEVYEEELDQNVLTILSKEEEKNEVHLPRMSQALTETTYARKVYPRQCRSLRAQSLKANRQHLFTEGLHVDRNPAPNFSLKDVASEFKDSISDLFKLTQCIESTTFLLQNL